MRKSSVYNFKSALRGILVGVLACMLMSGGAALAEGRGLKIATQLDASEVRDRETYTAAHRLLGVSSQDHAAMEDINEDYCAWLEQSGTPIDYPVTQGDDNAYYLNHSFKGESSRAGCLFLDARNGEYFRDGNNIVYGHHMKDDSMLATLVNYHQQDYYDEHPTLKLYTPYGDYDVEVFASAIVDGKKDFLEFNFDSDEAFDNYWKQFIDGTEFKGDVTVERGDRLISLVTCTYEYNDARYIVCGKLTPVEVWEE